MNPAEIEKIESCYAELQDSLFEFCTRCGAVVLPYNCNDNLDHDEAWSYSMPILSDATVPEGESEYWCPQCQTRWPAFARNDTAWIRACGHLMPFYVSYCAICGKG